MANSVARALAIVISVAGSTALRASTVSEVTSALEAGRSAQAADSAARLHEAQPRDGEAAYLLIKSLNASGQHEKLMEQFESCASAAAGTFFEARCYLERAASFAANAADATKAVVLYNDIISRFKNDPTAVSEALVQRGNTELGLLKNGTTAKSTYEEVLLTYPNSPQAPSALAGIAKCEAALLNPQGIAAVVESFDTRYPGSLLKAQAQLVQADFASRESGNRRTALIGYHGVIKTSPKGPGAAVARMRLADMALMGNFKGSIDEYYQILRDFSEVVNLPAALGLLPDWPVSLAARPTRLSKRGFRKGSLLRCSGGA